MIKVSEPCIGEEEIQAVTEVLESGRYVSGEKVSKFEEEFAKYIGTNYAIAVNSGTAALHVALMAIEIKDESQNVLVPPLTFFSTVSSVMMTGAIPIFTDIDEDTFCMELEVIPEKMVIKEYEAIMPVHLFGHPVDVSKVNAKAEELGIAEWVIEDCAQAHGAEYKGKKCGSLFAAGCFSFYATKNMTTGEGGMITTDIWGIKEKAKQLRNHGMINYNTHECIGYNYRMSEICAAIGLHQLRKLDKMNRIRIENSKYILCQLEDVDWIEIPYKKDKDVKNVYFWCPIRINEKILGKSTEELIKELCKLGIEVRHRYQEPLWNQPAYQDYCCNLGYKIGKPQCKTIAEEIIGKIIGLPNHPLLKKEDRDTIIEALHGIRSVEK